MEAIFFGIDIIGVVLLLYWAIVNDDHKPGTPTSGLFAYREVTGRRPMKQTERQQARIGKPALGPAKPRRKPGPGGGR